MNQISTIAVFVFDANVFDKKKIDAQCSYSYYLSLYEQNKDEVQYYRTLSDYENALNEYYMAADTFVKFVAKE